jgi:hypothetical protein
MSDISNEQGSATIDWKSHIATYVVMLFLFIPLGVVWGAIFKIYVKKKGALVKLSIANKVVLTIAGVIISSGLWGMVTA